jgi:hypothetical protein
MSKAYLIEGGLGKAIAFSALVKKISEKEGEKIKIITHYPDVFCWSPYVEKVYFAPNYAQERQEDETIEYLEPYKCEYQFNRQHICSWWAERLEVEFDPNSDLPEIALGKEAIEAGQRAIAPYEGKEIGLIQFSGGQPPEGFDEHSIYDYNLMRVQRNYPIQMANVLTRRLSAKYPNILWLNFVLKNEPDIANTTKIETPYIGIMEFIKRAQYIVAIDSSLAHFAAAAQKPAIALWNSFASAQPHKYGWYIHRNLIAPNMEHDYADILAAIEEVYCG